MNEYNKMIEISKRELDEIFSIIDEINVVLNNMLNVPEHEKDQYYHEKYLYNIYTKRALMDIVDKRLEDNNFIERSYARANSIL